MTATPKHGSWSTTLSQIQQQMLHYEAPDDSEIYTYRKTRIDVPLPFEEFTSPSSVTHGIYCYEATVVPDDGLPCRGNYLVMRHPLMINGFVVALSKERAIKECYNGNFFLPEERFVETSYYDAPRGYDRRFFDECTPRLQNRPFTGFFRGISVIYGLYSPYHQAWVNDAAPRHCFFMHQSPGSYSDYVWYYSHALLRFDFMPEVTDLLRRHKDQLIFPERCKIAEKIGFNQTHSSYYMIASSPIQEYNHDWMW